MMVINSVKKIVQQLRNGSESIRHKSNLISITNRKKLGEAAEEEKKSILFIKFFLITNLIRTKMLVILSTSQCQNI